MNVNKNLYIGELRIDIYNPKKTFGGCFRITNDEKYTDYLPLHFCCYQDFKDFCKAITTAEKEIGKYVIKNNLEV